MTTTSGARYDGLADWYDAYNGPAAEHHGAELLHLLGPGTGPCLDLGCGTGLYFDAIRASGRSVVGLDRSADQLRLARTRDRQLVQADAAGLPFRDGTFPTVTALWVSTDVDDFTAVLTEAARVLRPGGLLVFYGVHPCFNGPCIEDREDGSRVVHPNYRTAGWHTDAPWWGTNIRRRVGMRHLPLADLLNAFVRAGLTIDQVAEPGSQAVPYVLAVRATRSEADPVMRRR
jgi:SAM-dependent methyltransferase